MKECGMSPSFLPSPLLGQTVCRKEGTSAWQCLSSSHQALWLIRMLPQTETFPGVFALLQSPVPMWKCLAVGRISMNNCYLTIAEAFKMGGKCFFLGDILCWIIASLVLWPFLCIHFVVDFIFLAELWPPVGLSFHYKLFSFPWPQHAMWFWSSGGYICSWKK